MSAKKKIDWVSSIFIIGYHLILAALLPFYFIMFGAPSAGILWTAFILYFVTGLGITAGYHRLFSHSTYKTNRFVEAIYLFFGTLATQGSALEWSNDHRLHHAHIDKDKDPYSVTRGFWHAHILWMFKKQDPIDNKVVADLLRSPLVRFQHKFYGLLMVLSNVGVALLFGWLFNNYFASFLFIWLGRLFFLHHCTWFINSLAHYFGHQNYSTEHTAVDNYIISFLTFGEGYHNYHHTFAYDYRNGIRWYHFDPTKWLIWTLSKLGLAKGLRTINDAKISRQMIQVHKEALIDKLKQSVTAKRSELEQKIDTYTENLTSKISKMHELIGEYRAAKKEQGQETLKRITQEIDHMRKSLKKEWRSWKRFSRSVMKLKPAMAV